ncbi:MULTISPECIES: membrane-bound lytic murein transglycosylase MltC [Photobacterium]|uniref:Murein transglycosylase n=1 Tax=Photobacterium ganghwense TaxID=320778 RepID=A0A0J1H022_9GAMM|nr:MULTISPECIES: membrane-bound lytic murein transglycosylase MltC [Photobacterium]KLV05159.1 murein transglycosylase [Photobacterium ganghwense]MBV1843448.1 membrane-bound lytic murein transglycosylase MltC [Photobacterium ganghwense]PSU06662.1 membrane-bound lytic murein transglycosylase MltC [Photobacterium ganghwense]QSV14493.1 membrane-bound lytic murein transglycosylase MltC [Photobacterium ganghwense]
MKVRALILSVLLLSGCSREFVEKIYDVDYTTTNRFAKNLAPLPGQFTKDEAALDRLINSFSGQVKRHWGDNDSLIASKRQYVKYTDGYQSRAHVDFERGVVIVETVAKTDPTRHLKDAIATTLLTPDDPAGVDLYSDSAIDLHGKPFLYGQILDQEGKPIEWSWRANRFADYLIDAKLQKRSERFHQVYYVEIPMVADHVNQRGYKYASIVRDASRRYGIAEDLIYAIIKTESSFNPYAVSHANAYGLMQVVPNTAGADVFKLVKNKSGKPTPAYLFDPAKNIDTGTAYFYLLKTRYLKAVNDPLSLHYSMISAYNGGTGGVLNTFHRDRQRAMNDLNRLQPNQVYWALTNKHPKAEARRYLQKVTRFQKEFNQGKI